MSFSTPSLTRCSTWYHLYQPDETRYYAPWRQDPRPLGGLLHGAYAYLGVSDFWRIQRASAAMIHRDYAQMELARWCNLVPGQVVDVLLSSGKLTALGERFVYGMAERLRNWDERLPEEPSRLARIASGDHRLGWRLRNVRPDTDTVERLARAWSAGEAPPDRVGTAQLVDGGAALGASSRLDLIHMRLRDPTRTTGIRPGRRKAYLLNPLPSSTHSTRTRAPMMPCGASTHSITVTSTVCW